MAFPTLGILDDFNRGNEGPPITGWVDSLNGLEVVSNEAMGTQAAAYSTSFWDDTIGPDCEAYCTIGNEDSTGVFARAKDIGASNANLDGYLAYYNESTSRVTIYSLSDGSFNALGADKAFTGADGDKIGIECIGTTIKLYLKDGGAAWSEEISREDDPGYPNAGYLGAHLRYEPTIDDFGGGTIAAGGTAALTGTLTTDSPTEADIRTGGKTLIITLTDDEWTADVGDDHDDTDQLIAGIDGDVIAGTGWDAEVKANMVFGDVSRDSATVVTITLQAEAGYDIAATETITVTIPAAALVGGEEIEADTTFEITSIDAPTKRKQRMVGRGIGRGIGRF